MEEILPMTTIRYIWLELICALQNQFEIIEGKSNNNIALQRLMFYKNWA